MMKAAAGGLAEHAQAGVFALRAAVASRRRARPRASRTRYAEAGSSSATATRTRAASETRNPSAPVRPPSRRLAPLTRSLITRQPMTAPTRQKSAPMTVPRSAVPASRMPTTRPMTAASNVIRPRAEPRVPVVPASIPIAMPMPSSSPVPSRKSTEENLHFNGCTSLRTDGARTCELAISSAMPASSRRGRG